jgi:hypothetical protein
MEEEPREVVILTSSGGGYRGSPVDSGQVDEVELSSVREEEEDLLPASEEKEDDIQIEQIPGEDESREKTSSSFSSCDMDFLNEFQKTVSLLVVTLFTERQNIGLASLRRIISRDKPDMSLSLPSLKEEELKKLEHIRQKAKEFVSQWTRKITSFVSEGSSLCEETHHLKVSLEKAAKRGRSVVEKRFSAIPSLSSSSSKEKKREKLSLLSDIQEDLEAARRKVDIQFLVKMDKLRYMVVDTSPLLPHCTMDASSEEGSDRKFFLHCFSIVEQEVIQLVVNECSGRWIPSLSKCARLRQEILSHSGNVRT